MASEELILRFDPDDPFAPEIWLRQLVDYFKGSDWCIPRFAWALAFEGELARMENEELRSEMESWS